MISKVITFVTLFGLASSQIYDIGFCPKEQNPKSFEMDKFHGKWYEVGRVDNGVVKGETCVTFNFTSEASYLSGHPVIQTGYDETGKLEYIYIADLQEWDDGFTFQYGDIDYGFNILDTDYENYAVILGCTLIPPFGYWVPYLLVRVRIAWILSRTPILSAQLQTKLIHTLASNGIGQGKLTFPSTANCPSNY